MNTGLRGAESYNEAFVERKTENTTILDLTEFNSWMTISQLTRDLFIPEGITTLDPRNSNDKRTFVTQWVEYLKGIPEQSGQVYQPPKKHVIPTLRQFLQAGIRQAWNQLDAKFYTEFNK